MATPFTSLGMLLTRRARRSACLLLGAAIFDVLSTSAQDLSANCITSASLSVAACIAEAPALTRPSVLTEETAVLVLLQALKTRAVSAATARECSGRLAAWSTREVRFMVPILLRCRDGRHAALRGEILAQCHNANVIYKADSDIKPQPKHCTYKQLFVHNPAVLRIVLFSPTDLEQRWKTSASVARAPTT